MNDPIQQFHVTSENGNGNSNGAGDNEVARWYEPGEATGGSWEEPQWDEPQSAEPSNGESAERLTPAQLRAVVFRRAPLGKRGLDEHQVNNLLDRVEQELTLLTREKNALEAELTLLRDSVSAPSRAPSQALSQAPSATPQPQQQHEEIEATAPVSRGARLARVEPGHAESQSVASRVQEAHVYAASLLSQAQQTADQYIEDAQRYSRELIEDARRRRGELMAKANAEQGTAAGAESWEREAARLRAANRQYRGKLRDYFELLLMNLDEWETTEDIGASPEITELPH
ncbi:DivIVA domain-containing protein [Nonomuraea sp. NPDC000554]|uniref:DivIVA domain-containing protein n=1 Tax=Nonomuraea sp. NPDC000554 TaxID=3154259 RepID=UPI00332ED313